MFVFINKYNQVTFSWNSNNEAFTASSQEELNKILNSSCLAKR